MEIKINQKLNKDYYEECYSEWLQFRSVYKRWEDKIGALSLIAALVVYLMNKELIYLSVGLITIGINMLYDFYSTKRKWIKDRLNSKVNNNTVTMIFAEDQIQSIGPFTDVKGNWDFYKDIIESDKGIFLIPENGVMIYLQKKVFKNPKDIKWIINKIKTTN